MLPYASYLRVYEPIGALHEEVRAWLRAEEPDLAAAAVTVASEQRTALARTVSSASLPPVPDHRSGMYVLRRGGQSFFCPVDLSLRSWLSLTDLVAAVGDANAHVLYPPDTLARAGEDFLRWRRDHPDAVPHIRQSTWGVPRTWFVLVVEDEREAYDADGSTSIRYRAQVADARRRLAAAQRVLSAVVDDQELLDEVAGLATWLGSFSPQSWVELDYAGVARLLGDALGSDQSARDIHRAVDALRRDDVGSAAAAYRSFEERWRPVNAFERAN